MALVTPAIVGVMLLAKATNILFFVTVIVAVRIVKMERYISTNALINTLTVKLFYLMICSKSINLILLSMGLLLTLLSLLTNILKSFILRCQNIMLIWKKGEKKTGLLVLK